MNIGSEEMVTINQLVDMIADIAGKRIEKRHVDGPQGVRGRNSDNRLIRQRLDWSPSQLLRTGIERDVRVDRAAGLAEFSGVSRRIPSCRECPT